MGGDLYIRVLLESGGMSPSIFRLSEIAPGAFSGNTLTVYCAHSYLGASLVPRQNGWLEITWPGDEAT